MLLIKAWRIYYADESFFDFTMGSWAEASPFGVQAVVWYHPDHEGSIVKTTYGGEPGNDVYLHHTRCFLSDLIENEVYVHEGNDGFKMGMWMDEDGLYRIHDLISQSTMPGPDQ